MVDFTVLKKLTTVVRKINPKTRIIETRFCKVTNIVEEILEFPLNTGLFHRTSVNTIHSREKSILLKSSNMSLKGLLNFLTEFSPIALRIKGEMKTSQGWYRIDCVGNQVNFERLNKASFNSCLVIISRREKSIIKELKSIWKRYNRQELSLV